MPYFVKVVKTSRCYGKAVVFFFKQETAYELRNCDWSSDVCSSDLNVPRLNLKTLEFIINNNGTNILQLQRQPMEDA